MALCIFFSDSLSWRSKLVKLLTEGQWSHCGFYDPRTHTVIDSLASTGGVTEYPFSLLMKDFQKVQVYRFDELLDGSLTRARAELGKPYDWSALTQRFSARNWLRDDKWYSPELVLSIISEDPMFLYSDDRRFHRLITLNSVSPQNLYDLLPIHQAKKV